MRARSAAGMPGPLSATVNVTAIADGADAGFDLAAFGNIFDRVLEQIDHGLRQQLAIAVQGRGRVALVIETDVSIAGFGLIQLDQLARQRGHVHVLGRHFAPAAIGLRNLQ